jgi:hypothetical protein
MKSPADIVIIFSIMAVIMITVGLGIDSINNDYGANINNSAFTTLGTQVDQNYKNATSELSKAVQSESGASDTSTENNIIVKGFNAVLGLGRVVGYVFGNIEYMFGAMGLPSYFATLLIGLIITMFAIITYSWIRGNI